MNKNRITEIHGRSENFDGKFVKGRPRASESMITSSQQRFYDIKVKKYHSICKVSIPRNAFTRTNMYRYYTVGCESELTQKYH